MDKNKYYCRINGKIYNLKKIQEIIDENPKNPNAGKIFLAAVEEYGLPTDNILDRVIAFNNNQIPADYNEALEKMRANNRARREREEASKPKCPHCQSTNIAKISGAERTMSVIGLGILSKKINKSFKCKSCGYTW